MDPHFLAGWIHIRIVNTDQDPVGQKRSTKIEEKVRKFNAFEVLDGLF
jgi:hypothetical protein